MPTAPKATKLKLDIILNAWETLAPKAAFGGMTLDDFKAAIQPSLQARDTIATLEAQLIAAQDQRDIADANSQEKVRLVVRGVSGDPTFGPDSALYEAMGYIRHSERKSGLTRKSKNGSAK